MWNPHYLYCIEYRFWTYSLPAKTIKDTPIYAECRHTCKPYNSEIPALGFPRKVYLPASNSYQTEITNYFALPHVLWQVSFGFWVTWSISSCIERVFSFPKWVMISKSSFSVSQACGLNFLKTKFCQSSQIYLSPEKTEKTVYFLSLETVEC